MPWLVFILLFLLAGCFTPYMRPKLLALFSVGSGSGCPEETPNAKGFAVRFWLRLKCFFADV